MAVPLSSKQIAPDQYRHTPPAPLFGSDLISHAPTVWSNGAQLLVDEALFGFTFMVYSAKRNPHEFMFRFSGLAASHWSHQKDGDSAPPGVYINSVIKYVRQRLRLRPYTSKDEKSAVADNRHRQRFRHSHVACL